MKNLRSGGSVRLLVAALILLIPTLAAAKVIHVTAGEKNTIYGALAGANFGDVVLVGCGDYFEQALYMPDGVALVGADGDAGCVRIITTGGGTAVLVCMDVGSSTRIENLTVTSDEGGMAPVTRGAGSIISNASPSFTNVIFEGLEADYGGAVYCEDGSSPVFQDCWFENNYARATGGAVACVGASAPEFYGCLFVDNTAESTGGHINAALGAAPILMECTLVSGEAATGSGLTSWDSSIFSLTQIILVDGLAGRGWDGDYASVPVILQSDIFGNEGGDWEGAIGPQLPMDGNISADPQFCGVYDSDNPFTLNAASPCAPPQTVLRIGAFDVNCDYVSGVGYGPEDIPLASRLHENFPNPFNPRTTIKFDLKQSSQVELAVFDVAGRLVKRLVNRSLPAGHHDAVWEGRDTAGRSAAAGVYFFRLKTLDTIDTKRMTLVK